MRSSEAALGRGVGAQRPVLRGNELKKTGARSARARTRGQNPLVGYRRLWDCNKKYEIVSFWSWFGSFNLRKEYTTLYKPLKVDGNEKRGGSGRSP
jgi:hypothetical protein